MYTIEWNDGAQTKWPRPLNKHRPRRLARMNRKKRPKRWKWENKFVIINTQREHRHQRVTSHIPASQRNKWENIKLNHFFLFFFSLYFVVWSEYVCLCDRWQQQTTNIANENFIANTRIEWYTFGIRRSKIHTRIMWRFTLSCDIVPVRVNKSI